MEGERICGTSNSVSRKTALHPHLCIVGGRSEEYLDSAAWLAPVTGDWWTLAPMSTQRRLHSASVIAGQLYVVGGQNGQGVVLTYAKRFGLVAGVWRALAPMSTQHVVGGVDGQRVLLNSAERLAPVTGVWRALAPMSTQPWGHSASVIAGADAAPWAFIIYHLRAMGGQWLAWGTALVLSSVLGRMLHNDMTSVSHAWINKNEVSASP